MYDTLAPYFDSQQTSHTSVCVYVLPTAVLFSMRYNNRP